MSSALNTKEQTYALLESLTAPKHLLVHVQLVGEAAEELLAKMRLLGLEIRGGIVRLGVAIHDAGRIIHSNELSGEGNKHEPFGERLLLEARVQPEIARCSVGHARYESTEVLAPALFRWVLFGLLLTEGHVFSRIGRSGGVYGRRQLAA